MTAAITPEVIGQETQILEESPMTPAEQRKLVELETRIKTKLGNKMEADLAIGGALLQIQRERLYRSSKGGRKFEDYIKQKSHRFTPDGQAISVNSANYLRGFYYFREEVLPAGPGRGGADLPLPTTAKQVRPLLFLLDHLRRDSSEIASNRRTVDDRRAAEAKAIEIWKAAVTEAKGKTPTFDQVNRARLADDAAEAHRLRGRSDAKPPSQPASSPDAESAAVQAASDVLAGLPTAGVVQAYVQGSPGQALEDFKDAANHVAREDGQQLPYPAAPTIPAWEIERGDSALDAGAECKRITYAINDAHKAIGLLRGMLYSQINKYGSDYLGVLRRVDAGVYSLHNIDAQVEQMAEDIAFVADLLTADVGEGELAQSTIDAASFPTRA